MSMEGKSAYAIAKFMKGSAPLVRKFLRDSNQYNQTLRAGRPRLLTDHQMRSIEYKIAGRSQSSKNIDRELNLLVSK